MTRQRWLGTLFILFNLVFPNVFGAFVGVNMGTSVSNLPSATSIVETLKANGFTHLRLYDADSRLLKALAGSGIEVVVGVTNEEVLGIGQNPSTAASWVNRNINAHVPRVNITAIAVGSQVLTAVPNVAPALIRAMNNLHKALVASDLNHRIKISTPHSMDVIPRPFPPSTAEFDPAWNSTISQILRFLKNTDSFYMLNAFPYYGYLKGDGLFPMDYALFKPLPPVKQIVDPNTLFHYESMFEAMVDAAYFSIEASNFSGIPVVVTETGWPWLGGADDPAATLENAAAFTNNLIRRVSNDSGPPARRAVPINTYIYELFNEDLSPGSEPEKSFGVLFTNGSAVYPLSLSEGSNGPGTGNSTGVFCVARSDADSEKLRDGLNWACGQGQANCSAIQTGRPCFLPDNLVNHASYAYNTYFQKSRSVGGTCDFGGTAMTVYTDPSYGSCIFVGSTNSSGIGLTPGSGITPDLSPGSWSTKHRASKIRALIMAAILGLVLC